ncbi:hypothetical protein P280DRAFT_423099 [Massarina eburnea CBS 473.64]|uniref:Nucleoporin Nup133/Nup155-like C-terminal domain-containing protein n=1 Tax=Massarina eburnea CBS 473.64 TaxID=1395130 RepID=A0A6A6S592_9PLEO|nr:hypothetical protein P280DRAFT_423099 [Massarina eburnea CBS 473.64]
MFSVEGSSGSARGSLRNNSRRRPRNSDGLQQGRRKRSKLNDNTFKTVPDSHANGNGSLVMSGHATGGVDNNLVLDIPVREKPDHLKRAFHDDAAVYLCRNNYYSVKKLPSFPAQLATGYAPYRASALSSAGLALALTTDTALLWDYNNNSGSSKVLALPLPPTLKGADPLPLGAIVRNGPANDFGVVAVAPATGKIVFWESVDSAEARGHFVQRHQGVEGTIKLYSGERITEIIDIEHAGYILILSSGRLAQMTLRDSQGRPNIVTTVMSTPNGSGGSFFSFKGLLGGGIRKTIAAVQARPSESKGQMEVITATKNGAFQLWDLSWSGQQIFKREFDAHRDVLTAVQQGVAPETRGQQEARILDFAIIDQQQTARDLSLLALVSLSGRGMMDYFLLELDLSDSGVTVSRSIPLRIFHQNELPKEPTGTLLLPSPGHTAFVQFPTAVVIASLAQPEEGPEAQLAMDSGSSLLPFQDCVYFGESANVRIAGNALEHSNRKDKQPSFLLFVENYGTLQISATPIKKSGAQNKVTPHQKIAEATFYSTIPGTILDFSTKSRYDFVQSEIESAALSISAGLLSADFENMGPKTHSIEELLRKRAFALFTLNAHLQTEYDTLSFAVRWKLLWHAEKITAAIELWKWYQAKLRDQKLHPEAYPEEVIMNDLVKALADKFKTAPNEKERDRVRQFFLNDLDNIGILVPWTWGHLRIFYIDNGSKDGPSIMQRLSEANDVLLVTLETAYSFRQMNAEKYGIDPTSVEDGMLKAGMGHDTVPYFWTSTHNIVSSIRSLVDVGRNLAEENYERGVQEDLAKKIGKDNARLVHMGCQTHIERSRWAIEQRDEKIREMGRNLRQEWDINVRPAQIYGLMNIGLATEGMKLAEKYRDMPTLVNLIWDETDWLESSKESSQSKIEQAEIGVKLTRIKDRIKRYFQEYGSEFAEAYFNKHISENRSRQLFETEGLYDPKMLTHFLLSESSRSKLYWIERVEQDDFTSAGLALAKAAARHETNSWCKQVELSIAKLALMSNDQAEPEGGAVERPVKEVTNRKVLGVTRKVHTLLDVAKIRDLLCERLLPTVTKALDMDAAVDLLVEEYGQERLKDRPALQALLKQGIHDCVNHRVLDSAIMIDILTLMRSRENGDAADALSTNEFVYALRTLALGWDNIQRTTRVGLKGIIWKRLFIQDDWAEINSNYQFSDENLNEDLLRTNLGWAIKEALKMAEHDPRLKNENIWISEWDDLQDRGCTDGDLCLRFSSDDIRDRIIAENKLDQKIYEDYKDKHNLKEWMMACLRAARWSRMQSMAAEEGQGQEVEVIPNGVVDEHQEVKMIANGGAVGGADEIRQSVEVPPEQLGGDVEMADS